MSPSQAQLLFFPFFVPWRRARNEIFTVYYAKLQNFYFALKIRLLFITAPSSTPHGRKYEKRERTAADPEISPFIILKREFSSLSSPRGRNNQERPREIRDVIIDLGRRVASHSL